MATQRLKQQKLLILGTSAEIGGSENLSLLVARELRARGWRTQSAYPASADVDTFLAWCTSKGVQAEVHPELPNLRQSRGFPGMLSLWHMVRQSNPAIVNVHYGGDWISLKDMIALRLSGRRKLIVTVCHPTPWDEATKRRRQTT